MEEPTFPWRDWAGFGLFFFQSVINLLPGPVGRFELASGVVAAIVCVYCAVAAVRSTLRYNRELPEYRALVAAGLVEPPVREDGTEPVHPAIYDVVAALAFALLAGYVFGFVNHLAAGLLVAVSIAFFASAVRRVVQGRTIVEN